MPPLFSPFSFTTTHISLTSLMRLAIMLHLIKPVIIYTWIDHRKIPAHKVGLSAVVPVQAGKQWRFRKAEIDEWILSGSADDRRLKGKRSRADANNEFGRDE